MSDADHCECARQRQMTEETETPVEIRRLQQTEEANFCAWLMTNSEPWITLGRSYEESLKILSDPTKEVFVAIVNDEVVGCVILNMKGAFIGYIQTVCVMPEWRNKGIGSKLLAFAEARIFRETPNVFLCVSSFNTPAKRLYKRLGYEVIGELKDYIVSGYSEILLRKTITPLAEFKK